MRGMKIDDVVAALEAMRAAGKDRVYVRVGWSKDLPIDSVDTTGQGDVAINVEASMEIYTCPACGE